MDDQELVEQQSPDVDASEDDVLREILGDQDLEEQSSGEEDAPVTFMSEDEVPPELREQWRNMNKKFTQTQQELAQKRKELDALLAQLQSVKDGQAVSAASITPAVQGQAVGTGDPEVDSDPVLRFLAEQYTAASQEQDLTAMQRIAAEFQTRLQTIQVEKELKSLKAELTKSRATAQLESVRKNPLFAHVIGEAEEKAILQKIESGLNPEEAAWAVLGRKIAAAAAVKAHRAARKAKEAGESATVSAGRPTSPTVELDEIPSSELIVGDKPSIGRIWDFIKKRGGTKS